MVRNVVTVYNQETFEIGKIRVNRVITIRSLIAKIASHFGVPEATRDLVIRFGDLNLVFHGSDEASEELDKRLFSDLEGFSEANLIGVQILGDSKTEILRQKQERVAAERELKKKREQGSRESL